MTHVTILATVLPAEHRNRLMGCAREVAFTPGTRLFEEGQPADRFWVVRTGVVDLDLRRPGHGATVIESLGHGELVGCSWYFAPHVWKLGATITHPVQAWEFDADAVRALCVADPAFDRAVARWVGRVVAHRLHASRARLSAQADGAERR
ncbi:cyclic nucleotide-binding domain-containing protein [Streptomyces sp. TRM66268-LWL]|uniref:Cyclic nucleotide-binding domain-containing protein n=1 Tax=Streptomyces polyasparticus TaxID=2767826 RepID=A0ABR7SJW1_9ACTN|nr:cyclic nucleotide-binding domain-containing protein [Streptomyces polyasparticus]MBC9715776.1 cyclic nucleotide-binding domain-containing protein [Streptomyces polyasparticus]